MNAFHCCGYMSEGVAPWLRSYFLHASSHNIAKANSKGPSEPEHTSTKRNPSGLLVVVVRRRQCAPPPDFCAGTAMAPPARERCSTRPSLASSTPVVVVAAAAVGIRHRPSAAFGTACPCRAAGGCCTLLSLFLLLLAASLYSQCRCMEEQRHACRARPSPAATSTLLQPRPRNSGHTSRLVIQPSRGRLVARQTTRFHQRGIG